MGSENFVKEIAVTNSDRKHLEAMPTLQDVCNYARAYRPNFQLNTQLIQYRDYLLLLYKHKAQKEITTHKIGLCSFMIISIAQVFNQRIN